MLEEIKKGLFASFGAVLLTRSKIDEISRKLVQDAKLSKEDAEKLAGELVETGETQWQELETAAAQNVRKALETLGISNKEAIEALKKRLDGLELRVSSLEAPTSAGKDKSSAKT